MNDANLIRSGEHLIKDRFLYNMAKYLGGETLSVDTTVDSLALRRDYLQNGKIYKHAYYPLLLCRWFVKLYLAGKQRVVAVTTDAAQAVRLADMATLFFADYRQNPDADFNLGLEHARKDLEANPAIRDALGSLERHLRTRYHLTKRGEHSRIDIATEIREKLRGLKKSFSLAEPFLLETQSGAICVDSANSLFAQLEKLEASVIQVLGTSLRELELRDSETRREKRRKKKEKAAAKAEKLNLGSPIADY